MRLGVLGPARDNMVGLARAAQYLLDEAYADRILYLGDDGALDRVVVRWAKEIVGADPTEDALFRRAAERCSVGAPAAIDQFVESERARLRLRVFVSLPTKPSRSMEILDGKIALFVHDRATIDAEDLAAAPLLVFGRSDAPVIERAGPRMFVSPGAIGCAGGGSALLDDARSGVRVEIIDAGGIISVRDHWESASTSRVRVPGGA